MPRPSKPIAIALLAAARDGDITQAEAARRAGVCPQIFNTRLLKFKAEQARNRSPKALKMCSHFISFCRSIGWNNSEIPALRQLWWSYHDENGNLLSSARK